MLWPLYRMQTRLSNLSGVSAPDGAGSGAWSWTSFAGVLKKFLNWMDTEIWQNVLCRFCSEELITISGSKWGRTRSGAN